jgi:hypothetical protein
MAEQPDKPRAVQVKQAGYSSERTNDLKISKDGAQRIIARYLRIRAARELLGWNPYRLAPPAGIKTSSPITQNLPRWCRPSTIMADPAA